MAALRSLGIDVTIWTTPVEVPNPIPFEQDTTHAAYDPEQAQRFWRILVQAERVLDRVSRPVSRQSQPGAFLLGQF